MFIHRGQLFLRIAYAGTPLSGKTETLKVLLPALHGVDNPDLVFSPLAARGRTLYFDWAEYQGGTFRDGPLHCQIISVPGQASLHHRRRLLVEDADVVVFVVDSQRDQLEANRRNLAEITPWLKRGDQPPVGVIYQANKRDLPDILDVAELRTALDLPREAELYESSALLGDGVRICFVAAVRACVRRAELLRTSDSLLEQAPDITSGEQLLERLRRAEGAETEADPAPPAADPAPPSPDPAPPSPEPPPPPRAVRGAGGMKDATRPRSSAERPAVVPMADWLARPRLAPAPAPPPPKPRPAVMPLGVWKAGEQPPVRDTRPVPHVAPAAPASDVAPPPPLPPAPWLPGSAATLIEVWPAAIWRDVVAAAEPTPAPPVRAAAVFQARAGAGWQARSWELLTTLEAGRAEFKRQVAWLMRLGNAVSSQRCVVLAGPAPAATADPTTADPTPPADPPLWCVWQLVREQPTLALQMRHALEARRPAKETAQIMAHTAGEFVAALQELTLRGVELPIHFNTLARENGGVVYSAFLPMAAIPPSDRDPLTDLASELRAHIRPDRLSHLNVPEALRELERLRELRPQIVPTVEVLQSLLIGE